MNYHQFKSPRSINLAQQDFSKFQKKSNLQCNIKRYQSPQIQVRKQQQLLYSPVSSVKLSISQLSKQEQQERRKNNTQNNSIFICQCYSSIRKKSSVNTSLNQIQGDQSSKLNQRIMQTLQEDQRVTQNKVSQKKRLNKSKSIDYHHRSGSTLIKQQQTTLLLPDENQLCLSHHENSTCIIPKNIEKNKAKQSASNKQSVPLIIIDQNSFQSFNNIGQPLSQNPCQILPNNLKSHPEHPQQSINTTPTTITNQQKTNVDQEKKIFNQVFSQKVRQLEKRKTCHEQQLKTSYNTVHSPLQMSLTKQSLAQGEVHISNNNNTQQHINANHQRTRSNLSQNQYTQYLIISSNAYRKQKNKQTTGSTATTLNKSKGITSDVMRKSAVISSSQQRIIQNIVEETSKISDPQQEQCQPEQYALEQQELIQNKQKSIQSQAQTNKTIENSKSSIPKYRQDINGKLKAQTNINSESLNISQFSLGKCLGKGRFGTVHMARHKKTANLVAIKSINKRQIAQHHLEKQIMQEIKIHSYLNHPNVIKLYGTFADEQNIYLIMELATGGDLYHLLKEQEKKCFPEFMVANYIRQVCEALNYIHSLGVIHRDIKPENLLYCGGVVKLSDFGWATTMNGEGARKTFCGTLDYVSPEVVNGKEQDQRVDLWSIGILCYELITGRAPFEDRVNPQETYEMISKAKFDLPNQISDNAKDFINSLLCRVPRERMTLKEALQHKWLTQYTQQNHYLELDNFDLQQRKALIELLEK